MNTEQLIKIAPSTRSKAPLYIDWLNKTMDEFNIDSVNRQAAFLGQILHESGNLNYVRELASGSAYEFRKDLGNNVAGNGVMYKGRGLLQITGKANYTAVMLALNIDCLVHPELLETPENACRVSGYWWNEHKLNLLADREDIIGISGVVNCGKATAPATKINGLANRLALTIAAKTVLKGTTNA